VNKQRYAHLQAMQCAPALCCGQSNLSSLGGSNGTLEGIVAYAMLITLFVCLSAQGRISEVETARLEYDRARQRLAEAHKHALKAAAKNDAQGGIQNDVTIRQAEGALTGKTLHNLFSVNIPKTAPQTHACVQPA